MSFCPIWSARYWIINVLPIPVSPVNKTFYLFYTAAANRSNNDKACWVGANATRLSRDRFIIADRHGNLTRPTEYWCMFNDANGLLVSNNGIATVTGTPQADAMHYRARSRSNPGGKLATTQSYASRSINSRTLDDKKMLLLLVFVMYMLLLALALLL